MFNDLIRHVAGEAGLSQDKTKAALGIILNAADRQGSPFAAALFGQLPGARTYAAETGARIGAPTGAVARMIERTPGGKRFVASSMIRELHAIGLDHKEVGSILPAVSTYAETTFQITGFGHLGDLLGSDMDAEQAFSAVAA